MHLEHTFYKALAAWSAQVLASLAMSGMNVARLNMCHGNHEWHKAVIERIRQLNKDKGCAIVGLAQHVRPLLHLCIALVWSPQPLRM